MLIMNCYRDEGQKTEINDANDSESGERWINRQNDRLYKRGPETWYLQRNIDNKYYRIQHVLNSPSPFLII